MAHARDFSPEELELVAAAYNRGIKSVAALQRELGRSSVWVIPRLRHAGRLGMLGYAPTVPGFAVSQITTDAKGNPRSIQQKPERTEDFELPAGHQVRGVSAYVDADGKIIGQWIKTKEGPDATASLREIADELNKTLKRAKPIPPPKDCLDSLLNQYVISDYHLGMLAWSDETGGENWDLEIAERLLLDWFGAAIAQSPKANTAILCQLGDFLHIDSHRPETPLHRNILDADSRFQKIVRVAIRVTRQIVAMLLQHHEHVHILWVSANHDPASSAIFRETWAMHYESEPRITVDTTPGEFYAYEWGDTALFYHHGHRVKMNALAATFASKFREIYGRAKKSYGHCGHLHQKELDEKNRLMPIERHRTLAPPDAFGAGGGWASEQEATVIYYHRRFGETGRIILTPEMVRGQ